MGSGRRRSRRAHRLGPPRLFDLECGRQILDARPGCVCGSPGVSGPLRGPTRRADFPRQVQTHTHRRSVPTFNFSAHPQSPRAPVGAGGVSRWGEVPVGGDARARFVLFQQLLEPLQVDLVLRIHPRPAGPRGSLRRDRGPHCGRNRRPEGWSLAAARRSLSRSPRLTGTEFRAGEVAEGSLGAWPESRMSGPNRGGLHLPARGGCRGLQPGRSRWGGRIAERVEAGARRRCGWACGRAGGGPRGPWNSGRATLSSGCSASCVLRTHEPGGFGNCWMS